MNVVASATAPSGVFVFGIRITPPSKPLLQRNTEEMKDDGCRVDGLLKDVTRVALYYCTRLQHHPSPAGIASSRVLA